MIEQIRSGAASDAAQEELYRKTNEVLLERIRQKISPRLQKRLDPEDVLHTAFLRAMSKLDGFHATEDRAFFGWVFTIAKNLILDTGKRRSLDALPIARRVDDPGPRESQLPGGQRGALSNLVRRDYVESMLDQLSEKEAEMIRLRLLRGMSFDEIAKKWSKTTGSVRRFFTRSFDRLRESARRTPE